MFGPLPLLHRIVLATVTAAFGVLAGVWVAHVTPLPLAVSVAPSSEACSAWSRRTPWPTSRTPGARHPPPLTRLRR